MSKLESQYKKELARVDSVELMIEDHGILTLMINLDKESGLHQGFGNYSLDTWDEKLNRRVGTAQGLDYILQILKVFKVDRLDKIQGKMCYALFEESSRLIRGIQALELDGGEVFTIKDWCKQWGIED